MKNQSSLKRTFYSVLIIFIILLAYFLIPIPFTAKRMFFPLVAVLGLVFLVQGIRLTFMARKEKGRLKLFLMLTGVSAIAPLIFAILHNLFYGLAITFENLKYLFEPLQVTFFIIAIIIAPVIFIVGVVGSLIFFKGKTREKGTVVE